MQSNHVAVRTLHLVANEQSYIMLQSLYKRDHPTIMPAATAVSCVLVPKYGVVVKPSQSLNLSFGSELPQGTRNLRRVSVRYLNIIIKGPLRFSI